METSIRYAQQEVTRCRGQAEQYNALAGWFELPLYAGQDVDANSGKTYHASTSGAFTEDTFYQSWLQAELFQPQLEPQFQHASEELRQLQIAQEKLSQQRDEAQHELASLQKRRSQIPAQNLALRSRILDALEIPEDEIPFVGELLRVDEKEKAWEGAVVEPYIAVCHFVFNNGEGNCSQVEDMTIRQLRSKREAYQNGNGVAKGIVELR